MVVPVNLNGCLGSALMPGAEAQLRLHVIALLKNITVKNRADGICSITKNVCFLPFIRVEKARGHPLNVSSLPGASVLYPLKAEAVEVCETITIGQSKIQQKYFWL